MNRFLAIGAVALFSFVVAGTAMAQERAVLQEGSSGLGGGFIGSGPGGGIDNSWMRELLSKPETVYGRLWGKDIAGSKVYVETGGGALVTLKLTAETNMENIKAIGVGNDIEVQVKRNVRRLGTGSEAADVPEGDAIALTAEVIRAAASAPQEVKRRKDFAAGCLWEKRVDRLLELVDGGGQRIALQEALFEARA